MDPGLRRNDAASYGKLNSKEIKPGCLYRVAVIIEDERFLTEIPKIRAICVKTCKDALKATGLPGHFKAIEVNIMLSGDEKVKELNRQFMGKNKPTNVLSFPNSDLTLKNYREFPKEKILLGDIVLAFETISREAKKQQKPFANHLRHLVIHATLHLAGYDHMEPEQAEIMEALEIKLLKNYSIKNPYII